MSERVLERLLSNWGCVSGSGGFRRQGFAVDCMLSGSGGKSLIGISMNLILKGDSLEGG